MSRNHAKLDRGRWAALRVEVLRDRGRRCELCGKITGLVELDHIIPLAAGGDPWALSNIQVLDRGCHVLKSRGERPGARAHDPARDRWESLVAELLED